MRFRIDIKTSKEHNTAHVKMRNLNKQKGQQQIYGSFSSLKALPRRLDDCIAAMHSEMDQIKDD